MQHQGILMDIDIRSIISTVLLEQTQAVDSTGEKTITTYYSAWYREVLLRHVTEGVVYSQNHEAFVHWSPGSVQGRWNAADYTNIQELKALAELLGPYGVRYLIDSLSIQGRLQNMRLQQHFQSLQHRVLISNRIF